ncbi:hypothetical protein ACWD4V_11520 [Streptomyces tsukubensis]
MVTHSKEYRARTTVLVPLDGGRCGEWGPCPDLPDTLGETRIRSCEDLTITLESHGGFVARLLNVLYSAFRLLARSRTTGGLAGWSEWTRSDSGMWVPVDAPWSGCDHGQHVPGYTELVRAA